MLEYIGSEVKTMKIAVLDKKSLGEDTPFFYLEEFGELVLYDSTNDEEITERIKDVDVIVINKVKITEKILSRAKNLKLICEFATGFDNIDIISARKYGIAVCNVPAYSTDSVTLFTFSTVLALISHIREYNSFVTSGKYSISGAPNRLTPVFHEIRGLTWGIIGYGNIGRTVGEVAKAFGAELLVNKNTPIDNVKCVDIDTLCKESDIITIHCPLNDKTRALINADRINLMKDNVIIVNMARGAVLDEEAIANAIINKRIGAFGCDVYSTEPFDVNHPYSKIMNNENVLLTPHVAWGAYEARVRCVQTIAKNIKSFLNNERLNRVD